MLHNDSLERRKLTDNTNERDERENKEHHAVAESLNGWSGDKAPDKFADEGKRGQKRGVSGIEGVCVRFGLVGAELPYKPLSDISATQLVNKCTHGVGQDTTKAASVIPKKHIPHE